MNVIETIRLVASLLPAVIEIMKAVEEAIPGQGKGEQKLAAVRGILETVYIKVNGADFEQVWTVLEKVISVIVNTFNKTGTFQK